LKNNMIYDVAIIGGGPAGLTAGIYAARKKLKTVILAKQIGGQPLLCDLIENYPGFEKISGKELIDKMLAQNKKYGVEIREDEEIKTIAKQDDIFLINSLEAKTIIIATGRNPRRLNVPGEKEFEGKGVSYCTTCDAPLFAGKDVAVIGSGNSGLYSAGDLLKYAQKIYVLESLSKIMGDEWMAEELKKGGKVEFILGAEVKEIKGSKFVEKIIYNNDKEIDVGGVFISVGWIPAAGFAKDFLEMNEDGEIIIDPKTNETSVKGVFGAGDATNTKHKQLVVAAAEGAKAALSVYGYLARS